MESLCKEAVACVHGEERVQTLMASIRLQTDDNRWLEYADSLSQQATIDYQTRSVEVERQIESQGQDTTDNPVFVSSFTSQSLVILEALESNIGCACRPFSKR